jgi:Phosphatidylglycerophosphatase A and related proteins
MKNKKYILKMCATLGPVGQLPARGTIASALTSLFLLLYCSGEYVAWPLLLVASGFALFVVHYALQFYTQHDPGEIVLDEVVGTLCVFLLVPVTLQTVVWGFVVFRFFDITKTVGIRYLERLPGAWGVLGDDIAAGLLTSAFIFYFKSYFATTLCVL